MLMVVGMYFLNYDMVAETFGLPGFPVYLVYPLVVVLALVVLVLLEIVVQF